MNEKEKKEEKKDISADVLEVIEQSKVLLEEQKAEIERQREEIEKLKQKKDAKEEKQEVTDILKDFKKDITEMLQGYNRNNPGEDGDNESFEKLQMDMLKRRF